MTETQAGLSERLRRGIEEDVLAGRLIPGDQLDERSLAERYDVSRTPVREALMQLSTLGLVTMRPRQRAEITRIGLTRLLQMLETLWGLEAQAAQLAARRMEDAKRQELCDIQKTGADIVARGDSIAFNEMNWRFHLAIMDGSQNAFLKESARNLRLRLHPYRCYLVRLRGRMMKAHDEHDAVANAIADGRSADAYDAMMQHLSIDPDAVADLAVMMERGDMQDLARNSSIRAA